MLKDLNLSILLTDNNYIFIYIELVKEKMMMMNIVLNTFYFFEKLEWNLGKIKFDKKRICE